MKEKKTKVMTLRLTPTTKAVIDREAEKREWTPSKMAEKVLSAWAEGLLEQEEQDKQVPEQKQ